MVRTSLINLVNLRTRDIHWWYNGRKFQKLIHVELMNQKKNEDKQLFDCKLDYCSNQFD